MTNSRPVTKLLAILSLVGAATTGATAAPADHAPPPIGSAEDSAFAHAHALAAATDAREGLHVALAQRDEAQHALAVTPRTLPSGAPACGNTGGKAPACTAEMAEDMYQMRVERLVATEAWVERARLAVHEATQTLVRASCGAPSAAATTSTAVSPVPSSAPTAVSPS